MDGAMDSKVRTKFVNRLLLCSVVVCYLWLTSLQMAVVIVTQYTGIITPDYSAVYGECEHMYSSANEQKELYDTCVNNQINTCRNELEYTVTGMLITQKKQTGINDGIIALLSEAKRNCSTSLAETQSAMNAWTKLGVTYYTIPYNDINCSDDQIANVKTFLADYSSTTSSLYSTSSDYSDESDQTVSNLVTYVAGLTDYNSRYLSNKSSSLQKVANNIVDKVSLPLGSSLNSSFDTIDDMLDRLIACMGIGNASSMSTCDMTTSSRDLYDSLRETINNQNILILSEFGRIEESFSNYVSKVEQAIDSANSFYDSVVSASGIITWIISNFNVFSVKSQICGKTSPDWCDFSTADWYVNTPSIPSRLSSLVNIPDAMYIWGDVQDIVVSSAYSNISLASNRVISIGNYIISNIESNISSSVEFTAMAHDYSPPVYSYSDGNLTQQEIEQKEKSSIFKKKIIGIISDFNNNNSSSATNAANGTDTDSEIYNPTAEQATYSFQWMSINFEDFNIEKLILSLANLQNLFFLFDYIYRALQTIKLIRKYWNKSATKFPIIDLSYDYQNRKKRHNFLSNILPPEIMNGFKLFFKVLPFIYVQLLLIAAFSFFALYAMMVLYGPQYYSYVDGCVQNVANNTYISSKVYPLVYNYASSSGNSNLASKISKYNSDAQSVCSEHSISAQQSYNDYTTTIALLNSSFQNDISNKKLLSTCVHMETMEKDFKKGCCDLFSTSSALANYYQDTSVCSIDSANSSSSHDYDCPVYKDPINSQNYYPYKPPLDYLQEPAYCSLESISRGSWMTSPVSVDFNCSMLPSCAITCGGPDSQVIRRSSKTCSCTLEWLVHSTIMQTLLGVWVYLLMNVARVLSIQGLLIVFWKAISPKIFDYIASCDKNGRPIDSVNGTSQAVNQTDVECGIAASRGAAAPSDVLIKVRLESAIYRYETKGWIYLILGLLMNALWMLPLYYVQSTINYSSKAI